MTLRSSLNHVKQIGLWIWHGRYHILTFTAVIVTLIYLSGQLNYYPNIVSAFLSITGLLIILTQQILDVREFADHRPNTIRNWIMSFPARRPLTISVEGSASVVAGGRADVLVSISESATIENKVAFLLLEVNHIQTALGKVDHRIDDVVASLTKKSTELKNDLDHLNASFRTTIAGHIVGAYDINLFGITITICGTLIQLFCSQTA
jgi:hypothetical protein